jgi:hypothetical protein
MSQPSREDAEDEAFLRQFVLPEEDRLRLHAPMGWSNSRGYRWFRSPNIVCLEHYRRVKKPSSIAAA